MNLMQYLSYQLLEQACFEFEEIVEQHRIPIDMDVPTEPMTLVDYVKDCRMKLWDNAFSSYFKGAEAFQKHHKFQAVKGTELVVRRLIFR